MALLTLTLNIINIIINIIINNVKDLHKSAFETELCEIVLVLNEAKIAHNELAAWVKPEKVMRGFRRPMMN